LAEVPPRAPWFREDALLGLIGHDDGHPDDYADYAAGDYEASRQRTRATRIHGIAVFTANWGSRGASRAGCSGAANEIVDEGAAALGVVEERSMTAWDDLEARAG
jgi:hypothetical protein